MDPRLQESPIHRSKEKRKDLLRYLRENIDNQSHEIDLELCRRWSKRIKTEKKGKGKIKIDGKASYLLALLCRGQVDIDIKYYETADIIAALIERCSFVSPETLCTE